MTIRQRLVRSMAYAAVTAFLAGAGLPAQASVYQFQNLGTDFLDGGKGTSTTAVDLNVPSEGVDRTTSAGVFKSVLIRDPGTASSKTMAAYSLCNDLQQSIGWYGSGKNKFNPEAIVLVTDPTVALFGALPGSVTVPSSSVRSQVAYLMDTWLYGASYQGSTDSVFKVGASTYASNRERAAGLQAAVWDLWFDSSSTVVDPLDNETQKVMDNLLASAAGHSTYKSNKAVWLYNHASCDYYQDQLMTLCTPVPEPVFVQMTGLAGLIGLGFRLKRRRA